MEEQTIRITVGDSVLWQGVTAIVVPEIALEEPGYILTMSAVASGHAKHEFFALAQMAYYQFQDDELVVHRVAQPIRIEQNGQRELVEAGMVILRQENGELQVCGHEHLNAKKMLEATNRYCTRWVRLDI